MPIYTTRGFVRPGRVITSAEYQPSTWDVIKASWGMSMDMNPLQSMGNMFFDKDDLSEMRDWEVVDYARDRLTNPPVMLPETEQQAMIDAAGLTGQLKTNPGYTAEAMRSIMEAKRIENSRAQILDRAGPWQTAASFATGLAASFVDPVSLATVFIPFAGEARLMRMLQQASGSIFKRSMARAGFGALNGAIGAAALEPIVHMGQRQIQADYSMANSLLNIGFGAVMGATLHPLTGKVREWYNKRHNRAQDWEYVPATEESEALMRDHAGRIEKGLLEANRSLDPEAVRQDAMGAAVMYDAWLRNRAYSEQRPVAEYYSRYEIDYRSGEIVERQRADVLHHAMYRNQAENNEAASSHGPGGSPGYPGPLRNVEGDASHGSESGIYNVGRNGENVNEEGDDGSSAILFQKAFHGSPKKFKKFSTRHMGSGEGAQVHGWGLYFARDKGVASGYRTKLAGTTYTYRGKDLLDLYNRLEDQGEYKKLGMVEDFMASHYLRDFDPEIHDKAAYEWFKKEILPQIKGQGRFYEVEIPENTVLLDEQKPLGEQLPEVRAALEKAADAMPDDEAWGNMSEYLYSALEEGTSNGGDVYNALAILGTKNYEDTLTISRAGARSASEFLDHFGIRGITYEGSEDGRCYVIFNDKSVKITDTLFQAQKAEIPSTPEEKLRADVEAWGKKVDRIFNEGHPPLREERILSQTPLVMNLLDTDNKAKKKSVTGGVYASPHVFDNKHPNVGANELKQLPGALADPIAVFESESRPDDLVFMLDIKDRNGSTIIMPVELRSKRGTKRTVINRGKSAYAKDYALYIVDDKGTKTGQTNFPNNEWFIRQAQKNARYINGRKLREWTEATGVQFPLGVFDKQTQPNSRGFKIFTEEDLVNLKTRYPAYYQNRRNVSAVPGLSTSIIGQNAVDRARYEVWELDDLIYSHDPDRGFARRGDYPAVAQERPYHSDVGEQEKVRANALNYKPELVINNVPSAVDGPPVVAGNGIVLGGNSRAMTLAMVYGMGRERGYRDLLVAEAGRYGLDAEKIRGMKKPVLARVLQEDLDLEGMARKSREYNQSMTQKLQEDAEAVSRGRLFSQESLNMVAAGIDEFESLGAYFNSVKGRDFVIRLQRDGVIQETEIAALTGSDGNLNEAGKSLVVRALRGIAVADYDVLAKLPGRIADKLDGIVPSMASLKSAGGEWDLSGLLTDALRLVNEAAANKRDLAAWLGQGNLLGWAGPGEAVQALALTMDRAKDREIRVRFDVFAREAGRAAKNRGGLFGEEAVKAGDVFGSAFVEPVARVGKLGIGGYDGAKGDLNRAVGWALKNGAATVENAHKKIEGRMKSKKTGQEEKAVLMAHMRELAPFSGRIEVYEPNLGDWFNRNAEFDLRPAQAPLPAQTPRAQVQFMEAGRAVVTFFKSADLSSAPHELFHIIRRQMEEAATAPGARENLRRMWDGMLEYVGARPGEAWTPEMEEKFARAGERYLLEGVAPNARLAPAMDEMKKYFMEIYSEADAAGLEISDGMREIFNNLFSLPVNEGDRQFRLALGDILTRPWEREHAETTPPPLLETGSREAQDRLLQMDMQNLEGALARFETEDPLLAGEIRAGLEQELAALDNEIDRVRDKGRLLEEFMACSAAMG